jgi:pimeloyl-ACP methyl ester carboxylesterase
MGAHEKTYTCNNGQQIQLADGRILAYAAYGDPNGVPVLVFHGTPGSRLERYPDASIATRLNAYLIVVERPGYGCSDHQDRRVLLDWPDDVLQLADALGLERFGVIGFSAGGPYAAACADRFPQRITRAALLSSPAPFDVPGLSDDMNPANRFLFDLAARDPRVLERQRTPLAATPQALLAVLEASLPDADKAIFASPAFRTLYTANRAEAVRMGIKGVAWDMAVTAWPWGFDPADIEVQTHLWHGDADVNLPIAMGKYLAEAIPDCAARLLSGERHYLMFRHWEMILSALLSWHRRMGIVMRNSKSELEVFQALVSDIYDASLDATLWPQFLEHLAHALDAKSGLFRCHDLDSKHIGFSWHLWV